MMLFVTDSILLYSKYVTKNAVKGFVDFKTEGQVIFYLSQQPLFTTASSSSRLDNHNSCTSQSVGLIWTSDQPDAEASN